MDNRPLIDAEIFAAWIADARLAVTADGLVAELAKVLPAMMRMVDVG